LTVFLLKEPSSLMAIKADAPPWPLMAIAARQWLSSPPRSIKTDPRALRLLLRTPLAPPAPPPRPLTRRHRGPPPLMAPHRRSSHPPPHRAASPSSSAL
jgi:hypothetical protein